MSHSTPIKPTPAKKESLLNLLDFVLKRCALFDKVINTMEKLTQDSPSDDILKMILNAFSGLIKIKLIYISIVDIFKPNFNRESFRKRYKILNKMYVNEVSPQNICIDYFYIMDGFIETEIIKKLYNILCMLDPEGVSEIEYFLEKKDKKDERKEDNINTQGSERQNNEQDIVQGSNRKPTKEVFEEKHTLIVQEKEKERESSSKSPQKPKRTFSENTLIDMRGDLV